MKHIIKYNNFKINEAFDSNTLNSVMRYLPTKSQKNVFLDELKNLCERLNMPLSKINEDSLSYVGYNKAIKIGIETQMVDCDKCEDFFFFTKKQQRWKFE